MTDEQKKEKHRIFKKIIELVKVSSALGEATEDEQTIFLAETLLLVIAAGSNKRDSMKFSEHCINYLNEKLMETGELEVNEHLLQNVYVCNN